MARQFKYASLTMQRVVTELDDHDLWPIKYTLFEGGHPGVEPTPESGLIGLLDQLGSQGWELLGAPEVYSYAYPMKNKGKKNPGAVAEDFYNTSSDWVSRRFWFRREVGS